MKEHLVSLIVITDKSVDSPQTLSKKLKLNKVIFEKKPWAKNRQPKEGVYWVLSSGLEDSKPVEDHLKYLRDCFPVDFKIEPCDFILNIYVSIGVLHDLEESFSCSLVFPSNSLIWFYKFYELLNLEIAYYPGHSDDRKLK